MDRRDPMALSGSGTSYYTQRGMSGPPPPQQQQQPEGLHGSSAGIHALPSNPNVSFMAEPQMGQPEPAKRKRGRPRKYGPDGSVSLALSPSPVAAAGAGIGGSPTPKRSRGRPPGSGKKQQLASLGEWLSGSAGMGFTPHIITIAIGEDIATKIMSFSQQGPRAVCILSANGAVSTVTLRQPSTSGGTVTYEGRFEIICLSGSYLVTEASGSRNRSGGLSVSLASPDGRVIGGGVGGLLVAATPVQVIVGSFIWGSSKTKGNKRPEAMEAQTESIDNSPLVINNNNNSNNMVPTQNLTPTASVGVWPSSRGLDMRNAHVDIDLMRG